MDDLRKADDSVPLFSLKGKVLPCKVVDVYDGDTCTVVIKLHGELTKFKLRMYGYDSPEKRPSRSLPNRDEEIKAAKEARQALIDIIGDDLVTLKCGSWDKYGRLLGILYKDDLNINSYMIQNGFGYKYEGGTKRK